MHDWRSLLTAQELDTLQHDMGARAQRQICAWLAQHMQEQGSTVSGLQIFAELQSARAAVRAENDEREVFELLTSLRAAPEPAPVTVAPQGQRSTREPWCASAMKMIGQAVAIGRNRFTGKKGGGKLTVEWPETIWYFAQQFKERGPPGARIRGRSWWAGLGEKPQVMKRRFDRACDMRVFERVLAVLPLPIPMEENAALERLCVWGIARGEARAKRGVGVRPEEV